MEYNNIIISILIFIILMIIFYVVVNNLGIATIKQNESNLEKNMIILKNELDNLKNKFVIDTITSNIPISSETDTIKEIIIDSSGISDINVIQSDKQNYNDNTTCKKQPPVIFDPIANYDIAKLTDPLVDPRGRSSADQIPTPQVALQFNFPTQGVLDRYHRIGLLIAINTDTNNDDINKLSIPYNDSSNSEFIWNDKKKILKKNKKNKKYVSSDSEINNSLKFYKGVEIKENFDSDSTYDSDSSFDSDLIEDFGNIGKTSKNINNIYNIYSNEQNDNNILELIGKKITDNWYKYFTSITMGNKIIKVVVRNKNKRELYSGDIVFVPELKKTYRVKIDPMDMIEYNPYML